MIEQRANIVWAGARFRMSLKPERGAVDEMQPLQRTIEQRSMRGLNVIGKTCLIDGEAMILAGNEHLSGRQYPNRMIRAMVTKFHLHGTSATSKCE